MDPNQKLLDRTRIKSEEELDAIVDLTKAESQHLIMCIPVQMVPDKESITDYKALGPGVCEDCAEPVWLSLRKLKVKKVFKDKAEILCARCCVKKMQKDGDKYEQVPVDIKTKF